MKIDHLIQAYKINNIEAEIQEKNIKSGMIKYGEGMASDYFLDSEDSIVSIQMFFNQKKDRDVLYSIKVIQLIQITIMLFCNVSQKEANLILKELGMFEKEKQNDTFIQHLKYQCRMKIENGLLYFSISESD